VCSNLFEASLLVQYRLAPLLYSAIWRRDIKANPSHYDISCWWLFTQVQVSAVRHCKINETILKTQVSSW